MKKKIPITIILVLPVALFILSMRMPKRPRGYSITTEKDPAFDQKIERVFIVSSVEEPLVDIFANSFEHSLVSALQENGVDATYKLVAQAKDADKPIWQRKRK